MDFWKMAFDYKWVDAIMLKGAVITESNKFGEITGVQYLEITGIAFVD